MRTFENWLRRFWYEEDGLGTLEILLILAVLVAIAIVFRKWIISWVNTLFEKSQNEMDKIDTDMLVEPNS
jgi:Flp pilus assembly pilin Flp